MRSLPMLVGAAAMVSVIPVSSASAETREEYLARLKDICEVDCMQPRQFQRTARKRAGDQSSDMALIMDVRAVRRVGDKIQLHNISLETSHFEVLDALGSAGINTSQRNGIGGLPRGQSPRTHPNVVVVELDQQTLFDLLNPISPEVQKAALATGDADILVEGEKDRSFKRPTLAALEAAILNRRIVVRGQHRLEVGIVGARRDRRRKQAILVVDNAAEMALLPSYDSDGNPRVDRLPWVETSAAQP